MSLVYKGPSRTPSGGPSYSPDNLPVYRGGSSGASAATFDPNTLLTASQYGDFMRVSESTVASSGGLLTRWPGLRASANAGMRFDMTPYASAPTVGAYGPNGEQAIRLALGTYAVGSDDRGGASSITLPVGPDGDTLNTTGMSCVIRCNARVAIADIMRVNGIDGNEAEFLLDNDRIQYKNGGTIHQDGASVSADTWQVHAMTRATDGTIKLFTDGSLIYTGTDGNNRTLFRWAMYVISGAQNVDVAGYWFSHSVLTDEQVASVTTWMEG